MRRSRNTKWYAWLAACFIAVSSIRAEACPVCLPIPTKTAADFLIESEVVVFAREDPDKPFSYRTVKVLKGKVLTSNIELFVDSSTRRRLKANEDHVVVFVRLIGDQPWRSLGIADAEYQRIIRRVLIFANDWARKDGPTKRYEFFLPFFGHENPAIFELAYLELGRAPYSMIKHVARSISPDALRPMLRKREYIEWRSLAILMLAQNANGQDRDFIEDSFRGCQRFSLTTNLAAWATAYIELNGLSAVEEIEAKYLRDGLRNGCRDARWHLVTASLPLGLVGAVIGAWDNR